MAVGVAYMLAATCVGMGLTYLVVNSRTLCGAGRLIALTVIMLAVGQVILVVSRLVPGSHPVYLIIFGSALYVCAISCVAWKWHEIMTYRIAILERKLREDQAKR